MLLIVYYIATLLTLSVATVLTGFAVENLLGPVASLIVFLSLFFSTLWGAWGDFGVADRTENSGCQDVRRGANEGVKSAQLFGASKASPRRSSGSTRTRSKQPIYRPSLAAPHI
jgi:hypothetical protein